MSGVPRLSHLQFLVIGLVRGKTLPGRKIREGLKTFDVRKGGPAFYQLMSRLEDAGLVTGKYHQEIVESQIIRERYYTLTAEGSKAWEVSCEFYLNAIEGFSTQEGLAGA